MNAARILCDGAEWPNSTGSVSDDARCIRLAERGRKANVVIESIGPKIYECLGGLHRDLLRVAAFIYLGDRTVSRGKVDVFGERWHRSLHYVIPVSDPTTWQRQDIMDALTETASFASDDNYSFTFVQEKDAPHEPDFLPVNFWGDAIPDTVSLFSGGMDSLAGAVWDVVKNGRKPLLVSHYPSVRHRARQKLLAKQLSKAGLGWSYPHARAQASLKERHLDLENTQRARAILYLTLGFVVAAKLGIRQLRMYENGVVALNLPVTGQSVSSTMTRTSHPRFLKAFQDFANLLLGANVEITNPFLCCTRTQVVERLKNCGGMKFIPLSTSCAHVYMMDNAHPHCGLCSQCLDRQVALINHQFIDKDTPYRFDPFVDDPSIFPEQTYGKALSMGYFGTNLRIGSLNEPAFYQEFVDVYDALPYMPMSFDQAESAVYELFQRQSRDVERAFKAIRAKHDNRLLRGNLPKDCLLRTVGAGLHLEPPVSLAAGRLAQFAEDGLHATFRKHKPKNETEVQDALEGIFIPLKDRIEREFPVYCVLHLKGVRPDFSNGQALAIEVKYIYGKNRTPQKIAEEMDADISHYKGKVGGVLFIVYDPEKKIVDSERFTEECLKHNSVYLKLIR
jgi:7-cyano-7-deazaguanine synthase in queuosine biosynthesis